MAEASPLRATHAALVYLGTAVNDAEPASKNRSNGRADTGHGPASSSAPHLGVDIDLAA